MPYNGQHVIDMARSKRLKAKEFKAVVFPDRTGNFTWDELRKNSNPTAKTLEAIADLLCCPIDELFEREVSHPTNNVTGDNNTVGYFSISSDPEVLQAMIAHMRDIVARQDRTIERLEKNNDELNRRIDQLITIASHT